MTIKTIIKNTTGSSSHLAEIATLIALLATLGFILMLSFGETTNGMYESSAANMERVKNRIVENCLTRTRANDTVSPKQARPYNCFRLSDGNDTIRLDKGENLVYPGPGRDTVIAQAGTTDTEIIYEGGSDVYHFRGGKGLIDLTAFRRDTVRFGISYMTPSTTPDSISFDPSRKKTSDLLIHTPRGDIIVASHFENQPLAAVFLEDTVIAGADIDAVALSDQQTPDRDRILGTAGFDEISPGTGNDLVEAGDGNDIITYGGGSDRYMAGPGQDILDLQLHASDDVSFSLKANREDVLIVLPDGDITLVGQAASSPGSVTEQFSNISFSDQIINSEAILRRVVEDPVRNKSPMILGTRFSDIIKTSTSTRTVDPGGGNDTIIYSGGDIRIPNTGSISDQKTLDLSYFAPGDIRTERSPEDAMVIHTPKGTLEIQGQYVVKAETEGVPIDLFRLSNGLITDATFRARYPFSN